MPPIPSRKWTFRPKIEHLPAVKTWPQIWKPHIKIKRKKNDTFRPKNRKVIYRLQIWKFSPLPPTWHQIFKPIRMLVTIFISCISRYIPYLYTYKVWRILKDTFDVPSIHPSVHPSHPHNKGFFSKIFGEFPPQNWNFILTFTSDEW